MLTKGFARLACNSIIGSFVNKFLTRYFGHVILGSIFYDIFLINKKDYGMSI